MLLPYALKSALILAAAWLLVTMAMKRASAAARHLVWTGALASVVLLPLLSVSLPSWQAPVEASALVFETTAAVSQPVASAAPEAGKAPQAPGVPSAGLWTAQAWTIVAMVWGAGSIAMMLSMVAAYFRMARRRSVSGEFAVEGLCSPVPLLRADAGSMPMTFGIVRPVVFLPEDAVQWPLERLRMVLAHELAHVERADVLTQLVARVALALHWWNPLAWKAWNEFVKERECAADDLVLSSGAQGSDYAGHLLEVARMMLDLPSPAASVGVAMAARRHSLEERLCAILDTGLARRAPSRAWICSALLVAAPLAAFQVTNPNAEAEAALAGRQYGEAKKLLEATVAASRNPVEQGLALYRLGELSARQNFDKEAKSYYTKSAEVLQGRPEAGKVLIKLGVVALGQNEYSQAFELLEKAVRQDPGSSAMASMWMGVARRAQGNSQEAEMHFRDALSRQDPKTPDAITIAQVYAMFLQAQGRSGEAAEMNSRITAMRKELTPPLKPASAGAQRIGVSRSGTILPPKLLEKAEPVYSEEARAAKLQGTSVLSIEVREDGYAHQIQVLRPLGLGLDDRAIDAVSRWRFQPGTRNGSPVPVIATIEVNWKLL